MIGFICLFAIRKERLHNYIFAISVKCNKTNEDSHTLQVTIGIHKSKPTISGEHMFITNSRSRICQSDKNSKAAMLF